MKFDSTNAFLYGFYGKTPYRSDDIVPLSKELSSDVFSNSSVETIKEIKGIKESIKDIEKRFQRDYSAPYYQFLDVMDVVVNENGAEELQIINWPAGLWDWKKSLIHKETKDKLQYIQEKLDQTESAILPRLKVYRKTNVNSEEATRPFHYLGKAATINDIHDQVYVLLKRYSWIHRDTTKPQYKRVFSGKAFPEDRIMWIEGKKVFYQFIKKSLDTYTFDEVKNVATVCAKCFVDESGTPMVFEHSHKLTKQDQEKLDAILSLWKRGAQAVK